MNDFSQSELILRHRHKSCLLDSAPAGIRRLMRTLIMSTVPSTSSGERARRALTHGNGLDGVLFTLLTMVGVALLIGLLVFSFQSAETSAERDTGGRSPAAAIEQTEIGDK